MSKAVFLGLVAYIVLHTNNGEVSEISYPSYSNSTDYYNASNAYIDTHNNDGSVAAVKNIIVIMFVGYVLHEMGELREVRSLKKYLLKV